MARYPKDSSPKLTLELIEELTAVIRTGAYIETAVAYCGISKDTFYRWLREAKSEEASKMHLKLSDALRRSFAEATYRDLEVIARAANGSSDILAIDNEGNTILDSNKNPIVIQHGQKPNWKAAAWRLERRCPEHWGIRSTGVSANFQETTEEDDTFVIEFIEVGQPIEL